MARPHTVYRGKRKYGWVLTLVLSILVILILGLLWLFYYFQRFIVYDKDGLHLDLSAPQSTAVSGDPELGAGKVEHLDVEIVVEEKDYSAMETAAGRDLGALHARFVPADELKDSVLSYYANAGIGSYDALVLELKPTDGLLRWHSTAPMADSFAVNGSPELSRYLPALKDAGIYLVAQISALADDAMARRNAPVALKLADGSFLTDGDGVCYLDPFSTDVRAYLSSLLTELQALGFDEVLFSGFSVPDSAGLQFSQTMTQNPTTASAVSTLAFRLRELADELGIRISAMLDAAALNAADAVNGQSLATFAKAFDRIAMETAAPEEAAAALEAVFGSAASPRFVPVTEGIIPETPSYLVK